MMINFTIYNLTTGNILRTGHCPESVVNLQAQEGEGLLINQEGDSITQMVVEGVIVDKPVVDQEKTLDELKLEKLKIINNACRSTIYAGYLSSAQGQPHIYPSKDKDQLNMIASVTDSLNPTNDVTWQTPFWCANPDGTDWQYRMHTATQIQKAGADGKAHIVAQLSKNAALQAAIQQATTQEELELISW
jgi:hypothetical protein